MRPLHLTVVTAVSTAMLLATTSVFAVTPKVNLGLLKPQEAWKVGTVENNGEEYCAMVGNYGRGVVVAFARNPQGLGSLALDFGDALFTAGKSYDVSLTAEGLEPRSFAAKASADRSLVVQIGQDGSFYDALSKNGVLGIDMPAATLRIDLAKFSTSHQDLVECAGTLMPTEKEALPQVREARTNVDRAIEDMNRGKGQLADAGAAAAAAKTKAASSFDEIEAQLEAEARAEAKRSRETIASIEAQQSQVRSQLEEKGVKAPLDLAVLEPAAGDAPALPTPATGPSKGRKLLAAIGAREPVEMPFSTGASSRDIEARELGLADAARAAAETEQALALKNEIAALEAQKNAEAQEKLAAFDARQQELAQQTETLAEKRDNTLAQLSAAAASEDKSRGLRANVIAQQAKIAAVSEVKQAETSALTKNLASTQSDYESRIAALEAEREALRREVQTVTAENNRLKQGAAAGSPEDRLEIARLKKQLLDMETQRQGELARSEAAQRELEAARQQLAALRHDGQLEQARLAGMKQQIETERQQLDAARKQGSAADMSQLETLRQSLAKKESELAVRQSDLDKQAEVLAEETQRVAREKQEMTQSKAMLPVAADEAPVQLTAAANTDKVLSPGQAILTQSQRLVDAERAELEDLRGRLKQMQQDLADAREAQAKDQERFSRLAAAPAAAPVAMPSPAEAAELARLKDENNSLRQRLAGFMGGSKREAAVVENQPAVRVTEEVKAPAAPPAVPMASVQAKPDAKPTVGSPAMAALGLTAAEMNATEPAAGAPVVDTLPGNDKRMPAVPAAPVTAEAVSMPAPAPVQEKVVEKTTTKVETVAAVDSTASEAEIELARLAPITAPVPRAAAVPAASVQEKAQDKGIFGIFGRSMGYGAAKERAVQQQAAPVAAAAPASPAAAVIRVTHAKPAPQPVPAVTAQADGITQADANRAASFLDNIMAFHRPDGASGAPAVIPPAAPQPSTQMAGNDLSALNAIETAAGGPMAAPVSAAPTVPVAAPVPAAALTRPAYLQQAPVAPAPAVPASVVSRAAPVATAPAVPLDRLLADAGLGLVTYAAAGSGDLRQWTTGSLNGLYERASSTGNFASQVDSYLARYRADCPGKLDVRLGAAEKTASGMVQMAELTCNMAGNTYATTVAFMDATGTFHSVLHAGQVKDASRVRMVGQQLVSGMKTASDIQLAATAAPAAARLIPAAATVPAVAAATAARPRFKIEIEAPAAPPEGVYDLPTTIIE